MEHASDGRLVRGLRRWDLVALVINSIMGAGIFGLPAQAFAIAGAYSVLSYVASAIAIVLIVLCFAEVGSRFMATGGPYLYARSTLGPLVGFQVGWLLWVGRIAASASLANLFVGYAGYFIPDATLPLWRAVLITTLMSALAAANIAGVRLTASVTNILTVGKLIPLFLFILVGAWFVERGPYVNAALPSYGSFSRTALLLVFTYMGFEGATIPSGEMRHPQRDLPFALLTGFGVVALVYVSVQIVCIGTLPDLAHSQRPVADASRRFLGAPGASLIAAAALVSTGGTLNALMFATPRLLFAMAENRQLPRLFSSTHPRSRTPSLAIYVTAAMTLGLALFSTFISALTISAIVRITAYAITCTALPVLRRRREAPAATFVAPMGPVTVGGAVALSLWLLSNSPWNEMRLCGIAVFLGFVLYYAFARSRQERPAVAEVVG
jgi:amino acid transporter